MVAKIIFRKKEYLVEPGSTIRKAIENIEIVPESVIPTHRGQLIAEDDVIQEGDIIRLVPVITGGVII